jgi:hypothetical protein
LFGTTPKPKVNLLEEIEEELAEVVVLDLDANLLRQKMYLIQFPCVRRTHR